jgi:hypothetical protein
VEGPEVKKPQDDEGVDGYANVPPPSEEDGPQEEVDWTELEPDGHEVNPNPGPEEE